MTGRPDGFPSLAILFEDPYFIAVDKPAGVVVQRDRNSSWSLYDEVRSRLNGGFTGILHRLDRPVSGIVIFARSPKSAAAFSALVRGRQVTKTYHAVLDGILAEKKGGLVHYIEKRDERAVVSTAEREGSKRSELSYEVLEERNSRSLVRVDLRTGRYNQIRAQFGHIRRPVAGDFKYREGPGRTERIGLVASGLGFVHPFTKEIIRLEIEDIRGLLSPFFTA